MTLLDSDVLVMDLRYRRDPKYAVNTQVLQRLHQGRLPVGMTTQAFLEVLGIMSFTTAPTNIPPLFNLLCVRYGLTLFPDPWLHPDYASCTTGEVFHQMRQQMSSGDAVQAVQIAKFAGTANCLLTWNAKHFQGKVVIPVLTPQDWLAQQTSGTP